jgi:hypothetical protein
VHLVGNTAFSKRKEKITPYYGRSRGNRAGGRTGKLRKVQQRPFQFPPPRHAGSGGDPASHCPSLPRGVTTAAARPSTRGDRRRHLPPVTVCLPRRGDMAAAAAAGLPVVAGKDKDKEDRRRLAARCGFAVAGIMSTLLVYGVLQVRPLPPCPTQRAGGVGSMLICRPLLLPAGEISRSVGICLLPIPIGSFPAVACHQMRIEAPKGNPYALDFCRKVLAHDFTGIYYLLYDALALAFLAASITVHGTCNSPKELTPNQSF